MLAHDLDEMSISITKNTIADSGGLSHMFILTVIRIHLGTKYNTEYG